MTKELTLNKIAAALVGVAVAAGLAFSFAAERAHAVSLSELVDLFIALDIIPADKADEARAAIANESGSTPTTPAAATCNFTRNLKTGDTGADVMELQKLLNGKGYMVAAAGAGSTGMETQYYGPATAAAVKKLQEAFASDILTPLGLTTGTGFFGASTRAKANTLCAPVVVPPVTGDDDDDDDTTVGDDDDDDTLSGGEASFGDLKRTNAPSNVDVAEGEEEVKVAGFEFDVDDADAAIKRVYVRFDETSEVASQKPWDYLESVQLILGDEVIADMDASSKSDWEDLSSSNAYELRFTGLDEKVMADETAKLYVAVTTLGNIDSEDADAVWAVSIPNNGIRLRDGAGIDSNVGDTDVTRSFNLEEAGQGEELKVSLNTANPKSSIIKVDEDQATDDVTVLVFDLKAEESDMEITELPILFTSDDTDVATVLSDVMLEVDGEALGDVDSNGVGTTTTFEFESDEFVIPADTKVTVKVIVDLNKLTGNYAEGATLSAELGDTEVDGIAAEGQDVLGNGDKTGTAIGEDHQLMTQGIFAEIVSIDEVKTAGDSNADDVGDFKVKFDVTAFEDTYYISATTTSVFDFDVETGNGTASTTETSAASAAVTSTATKVGNAYRIDDGETETFTLTVTINPSTTSYYRVQLNSVDFGDSSTNTTNQTAHTVSPVEDFESDNLYLNA